VRELSNKQLLSFMYDSEEEREIHIEEMKRKGWSLRDRGIKIDPDNKVTDVFATEEEIRQYDKPSAHFKKTDY